MIIDFAAAKRERQPHISGTFVCVGCRHEWTGVAPLDGPRWTDCPQCSLPKATVKHPFGADEGDLELRCDCGCEALTAYQRKGRTWVRCMACGTDLTEAFYS